MNLSEFDYELPSELIAQQPLAKRTDSRLLHVKGISGGGAHLSDCRFADLPALLQRGDLLVVNDSRVIAARLSGRKASGGRVEVMIERLTGERDATVMIRASKSPGPGTVITLDSDDTLTVMGRDGMFFLVRFDRPAADVIEQAGSLPLPPYIERAPQTNDAERYQTVYASQPGSVAAPTAGLHFDEVMFDALAQQGIDRAYVTLHVGAGTFSPVRVDDIREHQMHSEQFWIPDETVDAVAACRARGGRVIAVGTTSLRSLESAAAPGYDRHIVAGEAETSLFISPGYTFKVVDALITNFHLPRSTLLMLVASLAGLENIRAAYAHAIAERYRFFSYGDAMLIEPNNAKPTYGKSGQRNA
ncbi:MAG: tRNA preQ1(34) S-adenosylmethionine ribosyltransferase-isomerase QueA [Burkholderiaceae bacterium]